MISSHLPTVNSNQKLCCMQLTFSFSIWPTQMILILAQGNLVWILAGAYLHRLASPCCYINYIALSLGLSSFSILHVEKREGLVQKLCVWCQSICNIHWQAKMATNQSWAAFVSDSFLSPTRMLFWHLHLHLIISNFIAATPFYLRRTWGCGLSITAWYQVL